MVLEFVVSLTDVRGSLMAPREAPSPQTEPPGDDADLAWSGEDLPSATPSFPERHTISAMTELLTQDNGERRHPEADAKMLDMASRLEANELEMVAEGAAPLQIQAVHRSSHLMIWLQSGTLGTFAREVRRSCWPRGGG